MEDKDLEYGLKREVANFILTEVNSSIQKYHLKYIKNIGYLLYYPLIVLEEHFASGIPGLVQAQRPAVSWFIKELMKLGYEKDMNFRYDEKEKKMFEKKYYATIINLYNDYLSSEEVKAMNPLVSYLFKEINSNQIEIIKPVLENKILEKSLYYHSRHDEEQRKREEEYSLRISSFLFKNYSPIPPSLVRVKKILGLLSEIDTALLQICIERVSIDLEKLGGRVKSDSIRNLDHAKLVLGSLYYLSSVKHYAQGLNLDKNYFNLEYETLIQKISNMNGIQKDIVERILSYLCLEHKYEGTITHFPIILYNNKAIFIPSSFMLNDWHFNLVNGHYHKKIKFSNRDKTISKSIVDGIINKAQQYPNIIVSSERPYSFVDENSEPQQSDIDVTLFDKLSNTVLVLECKWIDNHFTSEEEVNQKLINTVNGIYKDQLSKHTKFLNLGLNSLKYIFQNHPFISSLAEPPKYYYVAVDKRSQIHFDDKHMITFYMMLYMMDNFVENGFLNLMSLASEIESFKTKTVYFDIDIEDSKRFNLNGYNFITEDFNLSY